MALRVSTWTGAPSRSTIGGPRRATRNELKVHEVPGSKCRQLEGRAGYHNILALMREHSQLKVRSMPSTGIDALIDIGLGFRVCESERKLRATRNEQRETRNEKPQVRTINQERVHGSSSPASPPDQSDRVEIAGCNRPTNKIDEEGVRRRWDAVWRSTHGSCRG